VVTDLDALVREAIQIALARAKMGVRYTVVDALGGAPLGVLVPSECVTALVNLIVNAIDAMPGGGTIEVSSGASDGGGWLRVADDGPGMPPAVERRVFEPFFTTKGGRGHGPRSGSGEWAPWLAPCCVAHRGWSSAMMPGTDCHEFPRTRSAR
jgi:signal transduction histidine kinase